MSARDRPVRRRAERTTHQLEKLTNHDPILTDCERPLPRMAIGCMEVPVLEACNQASPDEHDGYCVLSRVILVDQERPFHREPSVASG